MAQIAQLDGHGIAQKHLGLDLFKAEPGGPVIYIADPKAGHRGFKAGAELHVDIVDDHVPAVAVEHSAAQGDLCQRKSKIIILAAQIVIGQI